MLGKQRPADEARDLPLRPCFSDLGPGDLRGIAHATPSAGRSASGFVARLRWEQDQDLARVERGVAVQDDVLMNTDADTPDGLGDIVSIGHRLQKIAADRIEELE